MSSAPPLLPHLQQLTSRLTGSQHPVNSWLWQRPEGNVLIDPSADVAAENVTDILITHVHAENMAGCRNFPHARVHVPAGDEIFCRGKAEYDKLIAKWVEPWDWESRGLFLGHMGGARNERPLDDPTPLAAALVPGQEFLGAKILATPGHGKHAVTIIATIDGKRVAFAGDLVCADGKLWNWFDSEWDYGPHTGMLRLRESARALASEALDLICPTHGELVREPAAALRRLDERLGKIFAPPPPAPAEAANPPAKDSPAPGFRQLLPALHQYKLDAGNCNVIVSKTGNALVIDDGLCFWKPLAERAAHHRQVIADLKQALHIKKIELVIPTHYHGDHTENIPELVELEGAEVLALDVVADAIEFPERYNLACPLPWYDTGHDTVEIQRRVVDGELINWHEFELEIFHLAGQTYYHLGVNVLINGKRVLFVGDGPNPAFLGCELPLCYNDNEPEHRGWAYAVDRMAEREPDLLVFGHAGYQWNPGPLWGRKQAAWRQRLEEFRDLSARPNLLPFFDPFV